MKPGKSLHFYSCLVKYQSPADQRRESPEKPDFSVQNQYHHSPTSQHSQQSQQSSTSALFGALKGGALGFVGKVKDASSKVMETVSA